MLMSYLSQSSLIMYLCDVRSIIQRYVWEFSIEINAALRPIYYVTRLRSDKELDVSELERDQALFVLCCQILSPEGQKEPTVC